MKIDSHGAWEIYRPAKLPDDAPANTMFARRISDGVDWYDYLKPGTSFAPDSVKMTVLNGTVGAAATDPTRLFPGGSTVLEVSGGPAGDPQQVFGRKIYDPASKAFFNPPPMNLEASIGEIVKRIEALESKKEA
jgi:hypothetical protein